MNCKGCNREITGDEYREVGKWTFCLDCFEKLLNPSESEPEKIESHKKNPEDFHDTQLVHDLPDIKKQCGICETEIKKGKEKKLGIWTLCESCYNDMVFKSRKTNSDKDTEEDEVEPEISQVDNMEVLNTGRTILCDDCGRIILEVAAKKDGDNLLCPDCFYKRTT